MNTVVIIRRDGTTPVTRQHVKHAWWRGPIFTLAIGEHGKGRWYEDWPIQLIDHVRIIEQKPHA